MGCRHGADSPPWLAFPLHTARIPRPHPLSSTPPLVSRALRARSPTAPCLLAPPPAPPLAFTQYCERGSLRDALARKHLVLPNGRPNMVRKKELGKQVWAGFRARRALPRTRTPPPTPSPTPGPAPLINSFTYTCACWTLPAACSTCTPRASCTAVRGQSGGSSCSQWYEMAVAMIKAVHVRPSSSSSPAIVTCLPSVSSDLPLFLPRNALLLSSLPWLSPLPSLPLCRPHTGQRAAQDLPRQRAWLHLQAGRLLAEQVGWVGA
mgnify:CR=1 FL=1